MLRDWRILVFHILFFSLLLLLIFMEVDALPLHRIVQFSSPILFMSNLVCNWREDLTKELQFHTFWLSAKILGPSACSGVVLVSNVWQSNQRYRWKKNDAIECFYNTIYFSVESSFGRVYLLHMQQKKHTVIWNIMYMFGQRYSFSVTKQVALAYKTGN